MSNAALEKVQYISDQNGNLTGVFLPIEVWRELESELETRYLLQSDTMKQRLLEARRRDEGVLFEQLKEMVADPNIQYELKAINEEFEITELDGLAKP